MATGNSQLRKRLFVNRAIQGRLLGRTALYWVLYHSVLWMAMFFYRYAEHRGAVMAGADPRPFSEIYGEFVHNHHSMWLCSFAILPIVLWDLLKFSHRVVGPLVRFQRTLERLMAGESVQEVRLRDGDLLLELQDSFNQYLASLKTLQAQNKLAKGTDEALDAESLEAQLADQVQQMQAELLASSTQARPELQSVES